MIQKSKDGDLCEIQILLVAASIFWAFLSRPDRPQAPTITLLKKWLAQYKFHNWLTHGQIKKKWVNL